MKHFFLKTANFLSRLKQICISVQRSAFRHYKLNILHFIVQRNYLGIDGMYIF